MSAPAATQDRTDVDSSSAEDVQPEVKQKSVSRRKQQTQRRKQQQQQQQMAPPQQQQMAPPQQEEKKDEGHDIGLRLDINLELEVTIKARIHGDLTLALLQ